jgi:predicted SprT family Zn-dependent metalloprotease
MKEQSMTSMTAVTEDARKNLQPFMDALLEMFKIPERIKANDEEFKRLLRQVGAIT